MFQVVFSTIDAALGFAPDWARISIWGLVVGAFTMLVYGWLSDQEKIADIKAEVEEARREMQEYTGTDFKPVLEMAKRSLALSLRQLKIMLGPTLIAGLPVVAVLIWMEESYRFELPEAGETVRATVEPADTLSGKPPDVRWRPGDAIAQTGEEAEKGAISVAWPEPNASDPPRLVATDSGDTLVELPLDAPRSRITRYGAWHWFFANPAGHLPATGPIGAVSVELPHRYVVPWGPKWLRTWHALFLVMLSISALAAKVGFDID